MVDKMQISVLASSSSGNVTYIETPKRKVLIDAGMSGKKIESLMNSIGRSLTQVDSLLVTHEHSDHCKGVGVLARRYGMDIYANAKTWTAMDHKVGKIAVEQKHLFEKGQTKLLDDLEIESFGVSHDAADPQFYRLQYANQTFTILTDTGYVSNDLASQLKNSDGYLIECNHDLAMLQMGRYPWNVKQRILGEQGHLSNEEGGAALLDLIGNRTKQIYLGHLSQENNLKALAHLTVELQLAKRDLGVNHDFNLFDTDPETATSLRYL